MIGAIASQRVRDRRKVQNRIIAPSLGVESTLYHIWRGFRNDDSKKSAPACRISDVFGGSEGM
jgi:hypothetical protein